MQYILENVICIAIVKIVQVFVVMNARFADPWKILIKSPHVSPLGLAALTFRKRKNKPYSRVSEANSSEAKPKEANGDPKDRPGAD
jgi:hypothetical protein